jgi:hypothetical protein
MASIQGGAKLRKVQVVEKAGPGRVVDPNVPMAAAAGAAAGGGEGSGGVESSGGGQAPAPSGGLFGSEMAAMLAKRRQLSGGD